MIYGGYTLWSRETIDSEIFSKPDKWFKIWFYLISKANHADTDKFKRGSCFVKYEWIIEKTRANKNEIDHCLRWLKLCKMLATQKATRGMIVFITNYDQYQTPDNYKSDIESDLKAKQKRIKSDTINKNDNNEKNENNNISIETRKKKHLYKTDEVTDLMCKEIAEKYQVSLKDVLNTRERMILYCGSTGTQYADYKLTLMNFVRSAIDRGQVRKIQMVKTYTPEMITITEEQRKKNSEKIAEIKNRFPIKTTT